MPSIPYEHMNTHMEVATCKFAYSYPHEKRTQLDSDYYNLHDEGLPIKKIQSRISRHNGRIRQTSAYSDEHLYSIYNDFNRRFDDKIALGDSYKINPYRSVCTKKRAIFISIHEMKIDQLVIDVDKREVNRLTSSIEF